jgi:hypothetical protein
LVFNFKILFILQLNSYFNGRKEIAEGLRTEEPRAPDEDLRGIRDEGIEVFKQKQDE